MYMLGELLPKPTCLLHSVRSFRLQGAQLCSGLQPVTLSCRGQAWTGRCYAAVAVPDAPPAKKKGKGKGEAAASVRTAAYRHLWGPAMLSSTLAFSAAGWVRVHHRHRVSHTAQHEDQGLLLLQEPAQQRAEHQHMSCVSCPPGDLFSAATTQLGLSTISGLF